MRKIWFAALAAFPLIAGTAAPGVALGAAPHPGVSSKPSDVLAITKEDRILGKPDAPVTIIEYASLSCPHCANFDVNQLPKIRKAWINTGKAKLILRDFPLDHSALEAAMIARCAPPDHFYAFVNAFFSSQPQWVLAHDLRAALTRIAELGGMDAKTVTKCLGKNALETKILESRLTAYKKLGVNATPTFFINGTKFAGDPENIATFEKLLQDALAKAKKG